MQCVEFEDRLNQLLDHRLSPDQDAALAAHAHECEECAGMIQAQRALLKGLRRGSPSPPMDLADRVISQRHLEVSQRKSAWRSAGWAVLLASAAGLAGLAVMSLTGRVAPQQAVRSPSASPPAKTKTNKPRSGLAMSAVGRTKTADAEQSEAIDGYFVVLENFATQISDSKEFDEMSESIEPSIKPIRSSFGLAIDALRRTLPRGKETRATKPDAGACWLPDVPVVS